MVSNPVCVPNLSNTKPFPRFESFTTCTKLTCDSNQINSFMEDFSCRLFHLSLRSHFIQQNSFVAKKVMFLLPHPQFTFKQ